jgi:hypothetical protein
MICFLIRVAPLKERDLKRIVWLLHPEVQCVLASRAVFAAEFLLPGMKMINTSMYSFLFLLLFTKSIEKLKKLC